MLPVADGEAMSETDDERRLRFAGVARAGEDQQDPLLEIGVLGRPHGVRGEVTLLLAGDAPKALVTSLDLYSENGEPLKVSSLREKSRSRFIVTLDGVSSREDAASLTGLKVLVKRAEIPRPTSGWYPRELVGLEVVDLADRVLGRVLGLLPTGGVDVLEIDGEMGPWMLPATRPLIVAVDLEEGRVMVDPPEGLLPGTEPA